MKEVKRLKQEVVEFKEEVKKLKDQSTVSEKFKESTKALNKVLSLQRSPKYKTGLGYNHKGSSSIIHENIKCQHDASKDTPKQQKNHKEMKSNRHDFVHPIKMKNFRRHANEKSHYKNQRFSKHTFYGYCHSYHKFGHKVNDCRIKEEH